MRTEPRDIDDYAPVTYDRAISVLRQFDEFAVADWLVALRRSNEPGELRQEITSLKQTIVTLRKRLDQYEPPAPEAGPRSYRAGPMSDG